MILYIDTTDFNNVTFAAGGKAKIVKKSYKINPHESHKTLQKLEEFLKVKKFNPQNFSEIIVNSGPGSYTGTRIGVTIAQALGFAWNIPVKALAKELMPDIQA